MYLVRLLVSQAKECEITVTLSDKTRSDGHKFKVCTLLLGFAQNVCLAYHFKRRRLLLKR
jgi:hypothetical protein